MAKVKITNEFTLSDSGYSVKLGEDKIYDRGVFQLRENDEDIDGKSAINCTLIVRGKGYYLPIPIEDLEQLFQELQQFKKLMTDIKTATNAKDKQSN